MGGPALAPWFPGEVHLETVAVVLALAAAYAGALRARGERLARARPARFLGALALLLAALNGPLHDLADRYLLTAHMVQHLLLTLGVAPLLVSGMPGWLVDAGLARVARRRVPAAAVDALAHPLVAFTLSAVVLIAWHLPPAYAAALVSHPVHIGQHLTLLGSAMVGWWPVLSPSRRLPRLPYAAQILYLFALGIPMTVVAAMVTGAETILYPFYGTAPLRFGLSPLEDQRLSGVLMWVPAGLIPLAAFTAVFFRWAADEADEPL